MLELRNLAVRIGGVQPVGGVTLAVAPSEMLGLVGESGSGKSLTLRAILQLLPPGAEVTGQVIWQGRNLLAFEEAAVRAVRGREIAIIFQEPMTALNPVLPVGLQITESLGAHLGLRGGQARRRAAELLDQVGIPDARRRLGSYPHEFSGGMRQRAMIAIALAAGPKLLLADEPTTALDVTIQDQILKLLLRLKDELGMAVVLVTHDLGVVAGTCDRVAVLYAGRVMEAGTAEAVFRRPVARLHARPAALAAGCAARQASAAGDRRFAAGPAGDAGRVPVRAALRLCRGRLHGVRAEARGVRAGA